MTTHLSKSEFVDLAEDTLEARRAAHVGTCASCREQAAVIRAMLRDTRSADVPEPSPLFWEHFSARVRDEIAAEPAAGGFAWRWLGMRGPVPFAPFAAAVALVIAVGAGALLLRAARDGHAPLPVVIDQVAQSAPASDPGLEAAPDAENAEVWAVLTAAASAVEFKDAHDAGMHVHPAAIDHAVRDLTAAERTELGRLLQSELKRSSN